MREVEGAGFRISGDDNFNFPQGAYCIAVLLLLDMRVCVELGGLGTDIYYAPHSHRSGVHSARGVS